MGGRITASQMTRQEALTSLNFTVLKPIFNHELFDYAGDAAEIAYGLVVRGSSGK